MSEEPRPVPTAFGAVTLTFLALAAAIFFSAPLLVSVGYAVGLAVGMVAGYGGVGTLAARGIAPPADQRIGLRGFAPRHVLPLLLLLPAVLLASEIDNWVRPLVPAWTPPEGAPDAAPEELLPYLAIELVIATVLLRPVLEEFFFRGVIQQGAVQALGRGGGVALTTFCYALGAAVFALPTGPERAVSAVAQALFLGPLLSLLRLASGSVLAPILAHMGMALLGALALAARDTLPIPGFNTDAPHTPPTLLFPAALSITLALPLLRRN